MRFNHRCIYTWRANGQIVQAHDPPEWLTHNSSKKRDLAGKAMYESCYQHMMLQLCANWMLTSSCSSVAALEHSLLGGSSSSWKVASKPPLSFCGKSQILQDWYQMGFCKVSILQCLLRRGEANFRKGTTMNTFENYPRNRFGDDFPPWEHAMCHPLAGQGQLMSFSGVCISSAC